MQIVIHSIGHTLGLAHTDGAIPSLNMDPYYYEDQPHQPVPNNGTYDMYSIMDSSEHWYSESLYGSASLLSNGDKAALRQMYPLQALSGGTIGPDQIIAHNTVPATIGNIASASGGRGTLTYRWQWSLNQTTWTDIPNASGADATYRPGALTQTTYYRRRVMDEAGVQVYSNKVEIRVEKFRK